MTLTTEARDRIESELAMSPVVLFMKGTPEQPQCGFSARTVAILEQLVPAGYHTVDVIADSGIREAIKAYSDWPTIPQLYIGGEFQGGCDLVTEMYNSGGLHEALGLAAPDRRPPDIRISDGAADLLRAALVEHPGQHIHLAIDPSWEHHFQIGPSAGHEIAAASNGITLLLDLATAPKAKGLQLDSVANPGGESLTVSNPNMPPPVKDLDADALKSLQDSGRAFELVDVRTLGEREQARILPSTLLDPDTLTSLEAMPLDTKLVFYCHTGVRSLQAAEHFRRRGFVDVANLVGGIDAWSRRIDPSVPLY